MLQRLLSSLKSQRTHDRYFFSVVVVDNDVNLTAKPIVEEFKANTDIKIIYCSEPRQNIALARNKALANSPGDFIAFIDDDEFPHPEWLFMLLETLEAYQAAGVLGPVKPHFESTPPYWLIKGRFWERPEYLTGRILDWRQTRTGNVLFDKKILAGVAESFNPKFGTGGEDIDFFLRMIERGYVFRWCNEGIVYETVPQERWRRAYLLKRGLLRGNNILKLPSGKTKLIIKSIVAAPVYLLILPFTLLAGQHVFMKYSIKLCDHIGRLLAVLSLNPVTER